MEAASGDDRDAIADPHAAQCAVVRKLQSHGKAVRTLKRNRIRHLFLGHTALTWEHRSIRHKRCKSLRLQLLTDKLLVIGQIDCRLQLLCKPRLHPERLLRHLRQHIKEQLFQLLRRDRAAICRKSHLDPRLDLLWRDLHSRALQHLLTGTAGRNQSAFSGASAPAALRGTE